MENKKELKIEITPEVAAGHYSNLAVISHSPNEVFIDFINMAPNMPQAKAKKGSGGNGTGIGYGSPFRTPQNPPLSVSEPGRNARLPHIQRRHAA